MKLLPIFATSAALLTGYQAYDYSIDNNDKCETPLKVGGKTCFEVKKSGFKKSKSCSSKKASALELTAEGKLCAGDMCLTVKGKKTKLSNNVKDECVYFTYDEKMNCLKASGPKKLKGRYPIFDKKIKKIKFSKKDSDKMGIQCSQTETPTPKPTIPEGWFHIAHRRNASFRQEGRTIFPKVDNGYKTNNHSSFMVKERVVYYDLKVNYFGWYVNVGWGLGEDKYFNGEVDKWHIMVGRQKNTIAVYQTATHDYVYNAYLYKYLNVGQTVESYRASAIKLQDHDIIRVRMNPAGSIWYRNGRSFMTHYWEGGDHRDLYPAFDVFYSEDDFEVTLGPTVDELPTKYDTSSDDPLDCLNC